MTAADPAADAAAHERPTVTLRKGAQRRALAGHPWVYSNEIEMRRETKALPAGRVVRLMAEDGRPIGAAMFNPHSLIAARILDRDPDAAVDAGFLARRLERALSLRERLHDKPFYRLVHAEADGLPGAIIDRFGEVLVLQTNTAGMERLLDVLVEAIGTVLAPETLLLRNDAPARKLEGLEPYVRLLSGTMEGPIELEENGVRFLADPREGQKTGWFFDQRENRARVAALARGTRLLDIYSYCGGFALQAAAAGAAEVLAIDRSEAALALAEKAAEMNGVAPRCRFRRADAFTELEALAKAGQDFDIVVADPPAFVKSKKDLGQGARAYRKLARLSAACVRPGGFLFIASCSHHMEAPLFAEEVRRGIHDLARNARILAATGAAPDHPVHPALPETAYLKGLLLQID
ncbi:MAG: class I SAM-dependent rRNA methyltransferase [Pseudomonadota bacterium]